MAISSLLGELLSHDWLAHEGDASSTATPEFKKKVAEWAEKRIAWEKNHGSVRDNVKRWVEFLKKCEARIDSLPAAFAGIGNDALLTQFLKTNGRSSCLTGSMHGPSCCRNSHESVPIIGWRDSKTFDTTWNGS